MHLSSFGYPDGALSIARNIYEQLIILAFFEHNKQAPIFKDYVDDYYIDYNVKRNKALQYNYNYCACTTLDTTKKSAAITSEFKELQQAAHHVIKGDYWWSGCICFNELVNSVISSVAEEKMKRFLHNLHFTYKRACISIHSSCIGNTLRLGSNPNFTEIDTSPTIKGHSVPLWFATTSFIYIIGVAYSILNLDYEMHKKTLNELAIFFRQNE